MTLLSLFSFLCGAVVGVRLKIFALLPIFAIVSPMILIIGLVSGAGPARSVWAVVVFIVSTQAGYLLPVLVRWMCAFVLAPGQVSVWTPAKSTARDSAS